MLPDTIFDSAKPAKKSRVLLKYATGAALLCASYFACPYLMFDHSKPAYDRNQEMREGKPVAWGPRPAQWLIAGDPSRLYSGNEWYLRLFQSHCQRWVRDNGYVLPSRPK